MAQVPSRNNQIFRTLFLLLFILVGFIALGAGGWMMLKSIRTEHWPVTDGTIQTAKMSNHESSDEHGSHTTYSADVTYSYQVGGANFSGKKIAIGQMSSSVAYAQSVLNRYPVGQKVSVHYSPDDPAEAVLETGIHGGAWICLGVGTMFVLFGVLFLQIQKMTVKTQSLDGSESLPAKVIPDGSIPMNKPPALMGVIFLLVGIGISFVSPDPDKPRWLMYAIGAVFGCGGLLLLATRLKSQVYVKILTWLTASAFLVVLHWVSFGAGDRTGTMTTLFSNSHLADVRTPFAVFTLLIDVIIVLSILNWLFRRRRD